MSAASRRKGVTGERELADIWEASGWTARGLEDSGDWLMFREAQESVMGLTPEYTVTTHTLHVEVKRQERLRMAWFEQMRAEHPPGVPPVLCWRPNRWPWISALPLADLLELIQ